MKIHLIGIGGLGISALSKMYIAQGHEISGTNDVESVKSLKELRELGVKITWPANVHNVPADCDLIVYSNAWPKNFPDFMNNVKSLGIEMISYPEALGRITEKYTTVAIAGTHGKTTTTAMVLHILTDAGLSPTGIVGSILTSTGSNFVSGESNLLVIEADEYMHAFLNYHPTIIGVTNIDHDHHDIYPEISDVMDSFREFGEKLPDIGTVVCSTLDQNSWDTYDDLARTIIDYSSVDISDLVLLAPGVFNKKNAQLAIAICGLLGVKEEDAKSSLASFKGTWRRQEYKGKTTNGALVYDDYAHHPTEISASLAGFKDMYSDKNITVIFQPHLYSRTKKLFSEFVNAFTANTVNQLIILPVFAAREPVDEAVTNDILVKEISKSTPATIRADDFSESLDLIDSASEIIITMGAGDVTKLSDVLVKNNQS